MAVDPTDELWVIVPAYNEATRIGATLAALADQTDRAFTLCVIDNASTDGTAAVLTAFAAQAPFPVVVVAEPEKGVGCAVDTGVRHAIARGACWIARTDADSLPAPGWTAAVRLGFRGDAELLIGTMRARRDENGIAARAGFRVAVAAARAFGAVRPRNRSVGSTRYRMHAGFNMAVSAALYERCGGMPRRPSPTDRTFMNRVRAADGRIQHVRAMQVATSTRRFRSLGILGTARWYLDRGAAIEDPR